MGRKELVNLREGNMSMPLPPSLSSDNPNVNENLKGLVLEGPLILPDPNEVTPLRIWTGKLLSSVFPEMQVGK